MFDAVTKAIPHAIKRYFQERFVNPLYGERTASPFQHQQTPMPASGAK